MTMLHSGLSRDLICPLDGQEVTFWEKIGRIVQAKYPRRPTRHITIESTDEDDDDAEEPEPLKKELAMTGSVLCALCNGLAHVSPLFLDNNRHLTVII